MQRNWAWPRANVKEVKAKVINLDVLDLELMLSLLFQKWPVKVYSSGAGNTNCETVRAGL